MDEKQSNRRRPLTILVGFAIFVLMIYGGGTISGCSMKHRLRQVQTGMTEQEVRAIMGPPYFQGHSINGRGYHWTWSIWFDPAGILVVEFSANGTVEGSLYD